MQKGSTFGKRLAEELELQKQNAAWLARELGAAPPTVYRWLKDDGVDPQPRTRAAVAQVLRVNEAWLAGSSDEKHVKPDPEDIPIREVSNRVDRVIQQVERMLLAISEELTTALPLDNEDMAARIALCASALHGVANATSGKTSAI